MSAWLLLDVFEWFHSISMSAFEFGVQSLLSVFSYNIFCQHRVRRLQPNGLGDGGVKADWGRNWPTGDVPVGL